MKADMREFLRTAKREGWSSEVTKGNHLKLVHAPSGKFIIASKTPSDYRSIRNAQSAMRRLLKGTKHVEQRHNTASKAS